MKGMPDLKDCLTQTIVQKLYDMLSFVDECLVRGYALSQHKCCWPGGPRYTRQLRWGMWFVL